MKMKPNLFKISFFQLIIKQKLNLILLYIGITLYLNKLIIKKNRIKKQQNKIKLLGLEQIKKTRFLLYTTHLKKIKIKL